MKMVLAILLAALLPSIALPASPGYEAIVRLLNSRSGGSPRE